MLTAVVAAATFVPLGPVIAQSGGPTPAAAEAAVERAASLRAAADRRVEELETELAAVDTELETAYAASAELAAELERARADVRSAAVAAYVAGGLDDPIVSYLVAPDARTASARRAYLEHRAGDRADAADRYRALKENNDPVLIELVERRERIAARLVDARDAAAQARAWEADAERDLVEARERAERERIERERQEARLAEERRQAEVRRRADRTPQGAPAPVGTASPQPATGTRSAPVNAGGTPSGGSSAADDPRRVVPLDGYSAPLPDLPEGGPSAEQWAALRQCESGGNYRAVSASGRYRGAYQFDTQTWASLGGRGDPAAAPPEEQDARAKLLWFRRGSRPWPHCGRHLD